MHCAVTKPIFILGLNIIAKYVLQGKSIDDILDVIKEDRQDVENVSYDLFKKLLDITEKVGDELSVPRVTQKQVHRSSPPSEFAVEYWKRSIIIPYLDSITFSLDVRFSNENTPAFALTYLHPSSMFKMASKDSKNNAESFMEFYKLDDVSAEL